MSEPEKQQMGDGSDNYGGAAGQMAKAARQSGQAAAKQAAARGARATANAAAATVKASVGGGRAAAEIAAGTAAGGPWGAVLSAAWAMRHTLYKVLVCICLALFFLIAVIVSLPTIVANQIFGLDGNPPVEGATMMTSYAEMADVVSKAIEGGYEQSLTYVEKLIADGGYDYGMSMDALMNYAQSSAGYDVCYILAAYSASMQQQNTGVDDMVSKLNSVAGEMFPVTYEERSGEIVTTATYYTYTPVTVTEIAGQTKTGTVNGTDQYRYDTVDKTYYLPDAEQSSDVEVTVGVYDPVEVTVPVYSGGTITGTKTETYYTMTGQVILSPASQTVHYLACTIHPFDDTVIARAFGIDMDAGYDQFDLTYGEAIRNMADALKKTLYGSSGDGQGISLEDAELTAFVARQECSAMRRHILSTALSLVGKVPYFWGGKSTPGWNGEWNTPKLVTVAGSPTTGTIRPYGLDCSGFSSWVFHTAAGVEIGAGCNSQYMNTTQIQDFELLPGDLGFLSGGDGWEHVLVFAGYGENGERMWVHSSSNEGVVLNTPSYEGKLSYRRLNVVDYDAQVAEDAYGSPVSTIEVDVTHYCPCSKCCGSNADGMTASGKKAAVGMVAMSSQYPFGTQIMINGTMYTVEDRGDSGIENDIHRVDIFVPDHSQALRMGRYRTTATIYRIGR